MTSIRAFMSQLYSFIRKNRLKWIQRFSGRLMTCFIDKKKKIDIEKQELELVNIVLIDTTEKEIRITRRRRRKKENSQILVKR